MGSGSVLVVGWCLCHTWSVQGLWTGPWACLGSREQDGQCSSDSRCCWAFIWAACVHPGFFYPSIYFWPLAEGEGLRKGENLRISDELALRTEGEVSLSLECSHIPSCDSPWKAFLTCPVWQQKGWMCSPRVSDGQGWR